MSSNGQYISIATHAPNLTLIHIKNLRQCLVGINRKHQQDANYSSFISLPSSLSLSTLSQLILLTLEVATILFMLDVKIGKPEFIVFNPEAGTENANENPIPFVLVAFGDLSISQANGAHINAHGPAVLGRMEQRHLGTIGK